MKLFSMATVVVVLMMIVVPLVKAESGQDTQAQIEALQEQIRVIQEQHQKQIEFFQAQIDALKEQFAQKEREKEELLSKLESQPQVYKDWLARATRSGSFKLRDALGLSEESPINISGEMAMQFKEPTSSGSNSSEGFRFYEVELFFDAALTENVSVFAEYPILYENGGATMEDAWIDIHFADELAATNKTGLKIGQFHMPFGWDNDDNEGYVYGGRTGVDSSLVRSTRFNGQRLRTRQIGIQGNYNLDLAQALNLNAQDPVNLIASVGVFNGGGPAGTASEWDNDNNKDVVARLEAHFLNAVLGGSYWWAPGTQGVTANSNDTAHVRDLEHFGIHFKYPDVPFPGEDISMGGSRYLIWGEGFRGIARGNGVAVGDDTTLSAFNETQKFWGAHIEADIGITPQLIAFFRYGYYDPDDTFGNDSRDRYTIGGKWQFADVCELTLDYQIDDYKGSTAEGDRIAAMYKVFF
jgi:hypothetical protein